MKNLMRWLRTDHSAAPSAPTPEVRRSGRLRCNMLTSSLGEVVDLSAAGMRIAHRGVPRVAVGQTVETTLAFASTQVRLPVRIVWMRRIGFRRHEMGVEFCDPDPHTRTCLTEIARCAAKLAGFRPEAA